jgi:hypothetical protein
MFSVKLTVQQGFHPRHFSSPPKCNNPSDRYYVIIIKRRGGMGGQAQSPPSSCECFVFRVGLKEFSRAKKNKTVFYSLEKPYAA